MEDDIGLSHEQKQARASRQNPYLEDYRELSDPINPKAPFFKRIHDEEMPKVQAERDHLWSIRPVAGVIYDRHGLEPDDGYSY